MNMLSVEYSKRVVMVKKQNIYAYVKKGLVPKVIQRTEAQYSFTYQNW